MSLSFPLIDLPESVLLIVSAASMIAAAPFVSAFLRQRSFHPKMKWIKAFTGVVLGIMVVEIGISGTPAIFLLHSTAAIGITIFAAFLIRKVLHETKERERNTRMAQELHAANEVLTQLDRAKSSFLSFASHQLRTPLTTIKGYLSMVFEGSFGPLDDRMKDVMRKLYLSNERLITLVGNFLNISRMEAGKMRYHFQDVDLAECLHSCVGELKPLADQKEIRLRYEEERLKEAFRMQCDEEKIRQVFLNLIDNAIQYTKEGTVSIMIMPEGEFVRVAVQDTGRGITAEELKDIFKPFIRGAEHFGTDAQGHGLGLAIAAHFVKGHGGDIWAESEGRGKGSTFFVRLPLRQPPANDQEGSMI